MAGCLFRKQCGVVISLKELESLEFFLFNGGALWVVGLKGHKSEIHRHKHPTNIVRALWGDSSPALSGEDG